MGFNAARRSSMLDAFVHHYISSRQYSEPVLYVAFLDFLNQEFQRFPHMHARPYEKLTECDLFELRFIIGNGSAYNLIAKGEYEEDWIRAVKHCFRDPIPQYRDLQYQLTAYLALHVITVMMQDPHAFEYATTPLAATETRDAEL